MTERTNRIPAAARDRRRLARIAIPIALSALLLPFVPHGAAASETQSTPATQSTTQTRSLLYRVTDAEGRHLWLLGSIHLADRSIYPLPAAVEQAFADSAVIAVEADVSRVDSGSVQQQMMQAALDPTGRTLAQRLPPDLHAEAAARLQSYGVDIRMFEPMRPWFVALLITNFALREIGLSPEHGIEQHFLGRRGEREVVELEGVPRQLQVFSSFSEQVEILFLQHAMVDTKDVRSNVESIIGAWRRGDESAIAEIRAKMKREHPELAPVDDVLFTQRNREMTEKIAGYLGSDRTHFVIVGAAHLVSEDGVVRMLERKGLKVERR